MTFDSPLSILLVEDDNMLRKDVRRALERHKMTVHGVATGKAALSALVTADAMLVDLGLPDMSGVDLIRQLRQAHPEVAIVAYSVLDDPRSVLGALRSGADGYVTKSASVSEVVQALRRAIDGDMTLSPAIARCVAEAAVGMSGSPDTPDGEGSLTAREIELLGAFSRGLSYTETAELLGITLGTVQTHVKTIYRKLNVRSRMAAVRVASESGILKAEAVHLPHEPR